MKDLASLQLTPEEFALLSVHCSNDFSFPKTWDRWETLMVEARQDAERAGVDHSKLKLDIEAFARWCGNVGIVPCLEALRAYSIIARVAGMPLDLSSPDPQ